MLKHLKLKYSLLLLLLVIKPLYLEAAPTCAVLVAKAISVQGTVETRVGKGPNWKKTQVGDALCQGDVVRTEDNSRATLQLISEALISVDQNTHLRFSIPKKESSWLLDIFNGSIFFRSREHQELDIHTPFFNAVHEGTEFSITVNSERTEITVFDGQVIGTNKQGKVLINKGFTGIAGKNQTPYIQKLTMRPEDAVQWTLHYPPLIDLQQINDFPSAIESYNQGGYNQALKSLEKLPADQKNEKYLVLKSTLLLAVGRVNEALETIEQSPFANQKNSSTLAIKSVIAVAKNRQDNALNLAQQAVATDPTLAIAQIALSYAYQAKFDLEASLKAIKEAIRLSPDNALAWARLSELQLSLGERKEALESALQAQKLNPDLSQTQTILGFANLMEVDVDKAKIAFTQAIQLNSADPLPRLGLGLAKIRKGDLEEGTRDLETAVSLDPENSILRSYLGKAYYDLRNEIYAATELSLAKENDPKDPTPWFYDAILKQTINRPVEALHDMEKAIELNDNRAVYRSSLMLDDDLAARSASLGRIYNDLGFQHLGLIEGWKSATANPTDYSSHRLLADNYKILPRHEIARVSELLRSQLLQPINLTPLQPQLAETNLVLLDNLGPSDLSFNEYNPLFTRNRTATQASGFVGGNDTWGDEITHSGLWNNISYSLGQFHYETDGFRENNFLETDIYSAFVQAQVLDDTSVQFEYRYKDSEEGDRSFRFDPLNFSSSLKKSNKENVFRFGMKHSISSSSSLLASAIYSDSETVQNSLPHQAILEQEGGIPGFSSILGTENLLDIENINFGDLSQPFTEQSDIFPFQTTPVKTTEKDKGILAELQHLYQSHTVSLISGGGYFYSTSKLTTNNQFVPVDLRSSSESTRHGNIYNYSTFHLNGDLDVVLGLSVDFYSESKAKIKQNQINPKFGLVWNFTKNTTFRLAAMRALKRPLVSQQTIEPTQIAGFNQFFDDINGTDTWRYGAAIDYKVSSFFGTGIELSARDLDVPTFEKRSAWREKLGRSYFSWTPTEQIAVNISAEYESLYRDEDNEEGIKKLETWRVPIRLSYFDSSGFSLHGKGAFFNQTGDFSLGDISHGSSNFWIFDLNLNYRFPNRYGMLSLGIQNLFDKKNIHYQSSGGDANRLSFAPKRVFMARVTFSN